MMWRISKAQQLAGPHLLDSERVASRRVRPIYRPVWDEYLTALV